MTGVTAQTGRLAKGLGISQKRREPQLQRRFAASPVYTCFAGAPFVGRGVEGWEALAPVKEEARVMFNR